MGRLGGVSYLACMDLNYHGGGGGGEGVQLPANSIVKLRWVSIAPLEVTF